MCRSKRRIIMIELNIVILILSALSLKSECSLTKTFVLQNEMSEHCRRQVVSSVFLGRQVEDSSSEVMHFSQLDLPYSCSISVRTQSGSNIVVVILTESDSVIERSCVEGQDQLLIYEMGETFGGYWAPLPQSVFQQESVNRSTYYTLGTPEPLAEYVYIGSDYDTEQFTEDTVSLTTLEEDNADKYVVLEIPLVNVSGNLQLDDRESTSSNDDNELFDLIYDVTPRNGVLYDTSVMPLVQFSFWKQKGQNNELDEAEPHYELDYNINEFTPDFRLMYRTNNYRRKLSYRPYHSTRRLNFRKKNKKLFSANNRISRINSYTKYISDLITTPSLTKRKKNNFTTSKSPSESWQLIENYLNFHNVHGSATPEKLDDEALALIKRISNMKHNTSVYLQPNLSKFADSLMADKKNVVTKKNLNKYFTGRSSRIFDTHPDSNSINDASIIKMSTAKVKVKTETENTTDTSSRQFTTITTPILPSLIKEQKRIRVQSTPMLRSQQEHIKEAKTEKLESGSLVDHESWENIVQVAPVMADLLNVTAALSAKNATYAPKKVIEHTATDRPDTKIFRKKRHIKALSVDRHRPRQSTTREPATLRLDDADQIIDSRHLAELVELQDDEIQGRVAMHYFKNYVGPTIFNMCDYQEPKARQVYLFNSSRIIIALSNFTMNHMTIVMTESRVAHGESCPPAHLECQITGVRVCVHTMNACDSIPNCGAYDIYDEDRLLCGSSAGFHYTVWLAACTFLVVLLTALYCVHYWLKRCVPKVSQAFFTYTDKSENILYLESIMRSPNDVDFGSRMVYHSSFYSDDDLSIESIKDDDNKVLKIIKICFRFLLCKKFKPYRSEDKSSIDLPYDISSEPKRKFSFTEAELRNFGAQTTRDTSMQTGDSLEMVHFKSFDTTKQDKEFGAETSNSDKNKIKIQEGEKELSSLRKIRSMSLSSQNSKTYSDNKREQYIRDHPVVEEVELRSTLYDRAGKNVSRDIKRFLNTKYETHSEPPEEKREGAKHLRFEEGATTIEPSEVDMDDEDNSTQRIDIVEEAEYEEVPSSSTTRDFRRFWGKGKKNKKKMHLSLR